MLIFLTKMVARSEMVKTGVVVAKNIAKKVFKYGSAALTGYELHGVFQDDSGQANPPNPVPPKFELQTSDELDKSLFDIKWLLVLIVAKVLIVIFLLLGCKVYEAIGKRATKNFKKTLEGELKNVKFVSQFF